MRKIVASLSSVFLFVLLCSAPPAHAVNKEMVQLQTQVQQLQDALQHLQETQDQQLSVLQHVVTQMSDSLGRINATVTTLQQQVQSQNEAGGGKIDQVSTQMQGVNDSMDALRTRIDKLSAEVQAVQSQLQNITTQSAVQQQGGQPGQPQGGDQGQPQQQQAPQQQAPPVNDLYQGGLRDYNSARYDLAASEFADVLKNYPQDDLAGNAQFYIGEIAYRQGKYADAIKAYNVVLQQFAGNPKAPAAALRKGEAELSLDQRDNGIRDLRALISRYPQTPEASQARSRLNGMGVRPTASKPTAYRQ
ncbi:MAG TPA: tol-pal system protein YbgF [Acidobacteriaceae bacterium]|jgi:tol-pal system protein YbgF|nr:tol-pal system protein YbgF [Acidobacteriaceae bacterium]